DRGAPVFRPGWPARTGFVRIGRRTDRRSGGPGRPDGEPAVAGGGRKRIVPAVTASLRPPPGFGTVVAYSAEARPPIERRAGPIRLPQFARAGGRMREVDTAECYRAWRGGPWSFQRGRDASIPYPSEVDSRTATGAARGPAPLPGRAAE